MLDYGELAKNPHHLNRNNVEDDFSFGDWWDESNWGQRLAGGLKIGADLYGDYQQYGDMDQEALQGIENPLLESYNQLMDMGKQYQDPHSALSKQLQDSIRTKDLSDFSDVAKRERLLATGEYGAGQQRMDDKTMSSAIGKALGNFSDDYSKRLQTGSNLQYQAGAIGQQLANVRKDNFLAQQERQKQQGMKMQDYGNKIFDFAMSFTD